MLTKKIYIQGMHCVSCEKLLNDEFRTVTGVKDVKVDRKANVAEIFYEDQAPDFAALKSVAKKFGYDAFESQPKIAQKKINWPEWGKALGITALLLIAYRVLQNFGIVDQFDIHGSKVNLGVAFLVGVVASVSSCLAVVGAVIIAFGEKYQSGKSGFFEGAVKPNLMFHAGRLATFFLLGGALGIIGGELNVSGNEVAIFTMTIAVVMAWLGLSILGIVPSIANLGIRMPAGATKYWDKLKRSEHALAPVLLGASSFFLPCGFTQSMQLFALGSGSFWTGALTLFIFALGTVPSLLTLGVVTSWTRERKFSTFQKVAGMLVVLFAVYTFQSGLALKGVETNVLSAVGGKQQTTDNKPVVVDSKNEQVVEMHVTSAGFSPSTLKIKKGVPVKWVIKGDQVTSCTNRIIVPSLNITQDIKKGDNVVRFTPKEAGTIPFSCWMGMVRGKFIVE